MPPSQTFFYGRFRWVFQQLKVETRKFGSPPLPSAGSNEPDIAIEIITEYGSTELRGKLHSRNPGGNWTLIQPSMALKTDWYLAFQRSPKLFVFDMQGTGTWEVLFFRTESDSNGVYFAVALRLQPEAPPWVAKMRKSYP